MEKEERVQLSYAEDLWDTAGFVSICERVNQGHKTQAQIHTFLKEKIQLDNQCCSTLNKMTKTSLGTHETGSLQSIVNAFVGLGVTTAVNHEILAAKLHEQVCNPLLRHMELLKNHSKKLIFEGKKLHREMRAVQNRLDKARERYQAKKKQLAEIEKLLKEQQMAGQGPSSPRSKPKHRQSDGDSFSDSSILGKLMSINSNLDQGQRLDARHATVKQELNESAEALVQNVSFMRGYRLTHDQNMRRVLDRLQNIEKDRRIGIGQALDQYFNVTKAMMESMVKNIFAVSRLMDSVNVENDIQMFIAQHRTGRKRPPLPELDIDSEDDDGNDGDGKEEKSDEQMASEMTIQPLIDEILANRPISDDQLETMETLFLTSHGRAAFAVVLNGQRNVESGLQLEGESFSMMAKLMNMFLDEARADLIKKQKNPNKSDESLFTATVRPVKLVMIMSQSFYRLKMDSDDEGDGKVGLNSETDENSSRTSQKDKSHVSIGGDARNDGGQSNGVKPRQKTGLTRQYIQEAIQGHGIWKELRFWEEAFYDSYVCELKKHSTSRKWHSRAERVESERFRENILFSQLASWAHNMSQFGMALEDTLHFVTKTCDANELDRTMVQMLINMVTSEATHDLQLAQTRAPVVKPNTDKFATPSIDETQKDSY